MEANAALRNIVRRDTGEGYREMLEHLTAQESGIEHACSADDLARLDLQAQGQEALGELRIGFPRATPRPIDRQDLKDGTTHLAYKPDRTRWTWTRARWWRPSCTRPKRATPRRLARPWRWPRQTSRRWMRPRRRRTRPRCVADKGYHARAVLKALDDKLEDPDRRAARRAIRAGAVTRRRGARSPTTAHGSPRGRPRGLQAARRDRRALLCPQPGSRRRMRRPLECAGARTCTSDPLLHVAGHNLSLLMRQRIGAGTPREAVAGGYGYYSRAYCARWSRSGRSDRPHRPGGWRNRLRRSMFRRGVNPGQWRLFQRAVYTSPVGASIGHLQLSMGRRPRPGPLVGCKHAPRHPRCLPSTLRHILRWFVAAKRQSAAM